MVTLIDTLALLHRVDWRGVGLVGFGFTADGQLLDFASLPGAAKAILMFDMYAGRLEIVTLAVLLVPGFWRLPRRRNHG